MKEIFSIELKKSNSNTLLIEIGKSHMTIALLYTNELLSLKHYVSTNGTVSKADFEQILTPDALQCTKVVIGVTHAKYTLVPAALCDILKLDLYTQHSFDTDSNEQVAYHTIHNTYGSVFAIKNATKEIIKKRFEKTTIVHASANVLAAYEHYIHSSAVKDACFINIHPEGFTCSVFKNKTNQLHTFYENNAKENCLYYAANACRVFGMEQEDIAIIIHGENAEMVQHTKQHLKPFFKNSSSIGVPHTISNASALQVPEDVSFFTVLSLHTCVL